MSEEQTTEPQVDASQTTETVEPQVDASQTDGAAEASPETTGESSKEDWWDTKGLDEKIAGRISSIRTQYNKRSEEAKRTSERLNELETKYRTDIEKIRNSIMSPNYLQEVEAARRTLLGISAANPQTNATPTVPKEGFQTVEAFQEWLGNTYSPWVEARAEERALRKLQPMQQAFYKDRWTQANSALKAKYPNIYDKYANQALEAASTMYESLHRTGKDEIAILEDAFWTIPAARDELVNSTKQATLAGVKAKVKATTEKPNGRAAGGSPKTAEEHIADLRRQGLSFES